MNGGKPLTTREFHVLLHLLEERSVTRTAEALDLNQPYVSLVLKRLREATGDPILVRSGAKLVLTVRGEQMIAPLRDVLKGVDAIVGPPAQFDPTTATGEFRIASADCMEAIILPSLIARLQSAAPGVRVVVRAVDQAFDYAGALERDELDVVISNWPGAPQHLKTARLLSEEVVCLFGPEHPFAGQERITLQDYLAADHLAPVARSKADPGPIDSHLAEAGLKRDIRVMLPEFNLIPHMLMKGQLVFTSSANFARYQSSILPLSSRPAPAECGSLDFYLLWHERAQADARNTWLRQQVMAVARELKSI
ncbi:LysR family transcriptional regulator [Celeribacter neptunius]|uniref:Transcriptional regulator, LysR family n=1 Tax=Celeribacter neptunius TaxID=588602 RepID=A0A1I3THS4_9RHOB|nr:LysR family transcriptional regulator [Celeribacter neptunius]SFJ69181.1 transcriptional regulator, LysR family [Celeribacter neptunius]